MDNILNAVLKNGQIFIDREAGTSTTLMYVGDGVTPLSDLKPVGMLPDLPPDDGLLYGMQNKTWTPYVILDEDGNFIYPAIPEVGSGTGSSGGSASVGEVRSFLAVTAPEGWLECDGSTLDKADYPDLYDCLSLLNAGYITDADYFVLPDLRDEFLRGRSTARLVGTKELDALQNITGTISGIFGTSGIGGSGGAFYLYNSWSNKLTAPGQTGTWINAGIAMNVARVVRTSEETRPRNMATLYAIKY